MKQYDSHPLVSKQELMQWASVPRSSYYYKRASGMPGRRHSTMTITKDGELGDTAVVLQQTESMLQKEFSCYGYKNFWDELKQLG